MIQYYRNIIENGETVSRPFFYSSDMSRSVGRRRFKPRIIVGVNVPGGGTNRTKEKTQLNA